MANNPEEVVVVKEAGRNSYATGNLAAIETAS